MDRLLFTYSQPFSNLTFHIYPADFEYVKQFLENPFRPVWNGRRTPSTNDASQLIVICSSEDESLPFAIKTLYRSHRKIIREQNPRSLTLAQPALEEATLSFSYEDGKLSYPEE